jgi:predicted membrane-bound mannosyltransferase
VQRAAGNAVSEGAAYHVHPWWQYLKWLFENTLLAAYVPAGILCGFSALLRRKKETIASGQPLATAFVATTCYSLILTVAYSSIPYKTPWCALQIYLPLLLSAFLGCAMCASQGKAHRIVLALFTLALLCDNCLLSARMWREPDSKEIPYNYASASPQVKDMAKLVENIVSEKKKAGNTFIAVAVPAEDTWPLPFYLRGLDARIGYWTHFDELKVLSALKRIPDIVIVPAEDGHKVQPLFPHLKNTKRFEMRHRVRVRVFW